METGRCPQCGQVRDGSPEAAWKPTAHLRWEHSYGSYSALIRVLEQEYIRETTRPDGAVDTERVWRPVPIKGQNER